MGAGPWNTRNHRQAWHMHAGTLAFARDDIRSAGMIVAPGGSKGVSPLSGGLRARSGLSDGKKKKDARRRPMMSNLPIVSWW